MAKFSQLSRINQRRKRRGLHKEVELLIDFEQLAWEKVLLQISKISKVPIADLPSQKFQPLHIAITAWGIHYANLVLLKRWPSTEQKFNSRMEQRLKPGGADAV